MQINCFVDVYKPTRQFINKNPIFFQLLLNTSPFDYSLQEFIMILGLLDTLDCWDLYDNSKFNLSKLELPLSSTSLKNEISNYQFSNQQLNSNLLDPINRYSNERSNIKTLLYIFYKVNGNMEYLISYGNEIEKLYYTNTIAGIHYEESRLAMEYGDYKLLVASLNRLNSQHHYNKLDSIVNFYLQLDCSIFKHCLDKELQIQFLNSLINDFKSDFANQQQDIFKIPPGLIFLLLVRNDDLELIKYWVKEIGGKKIAISIQNETIKKHLGHNVNINTILLVSITKLIQSIDVLNYIFQEFYNTIEMVHGLVSSPSNPNNYIRCQIVDYKLLNHFISLYLKKHQQEENIKPKKLSIDIGREYTVLFAKQVFNNVSLFNLNNIYCGYPDLITTIKPIDLEDSNENTETYFSSLKNAIKDNPNFYFQPFLFYNVVDYCPNCLIQFLRWYCNGIGYQYFKKNKYRVYTPVAYLIGGYDKYFEMDLQSYYSVQYSAFWEYEKAVNISIKRGDTKTLGRILTILLNQYDNATKENNNIINSLNFRFIYELKSIHKFLFTILEHVVKEGQILILEFILLNYYHLFKSSKVYLFSNDNLCEFMKISKRNGDNSVYEFLHSIYIQ